MSTLHLLASNGDPLYFAGLNWAVLLIVLIKVVISFAVCMGAVTMMIWFERKAISDMQSRIGPDRAGPWGILQSLADGIKLFFKEDLIPEQADSFVFKLPRPCNQRAWWSCGSLHQALCLESYQGVASKWAHNSVGTWESMPAKHLGSGHCARSTFLAEGLGDGPSLLAADQPLR